MNQAPELSTVSAHIQDKNAVPAPPLTMGCYRLEFLTKDPVWLPAYAGSAWRGVFGRALKQTVCVTHEPACVNCLLYRNCVYPYIFETPPPEHTDRMRQYSAIPHPCVMYPLPQTDRPVPAGKLLSLELTVFGRANAHLPYMIHALQSAAQRGIGKSSGKLELQRVKQDIHGNGSWQAIWDPDSSLKQQNPFVPTAPDSPEHILVEFQTPLRLKRDGHLVGAKEFAFHDLFRNLLRRIAMLVYFHEQADFEPHFSGLVEAAQQIGIVKNDLHWREWTRYSSRQQTTMQMGGLVGAITLRGEDLQPFWPLLWLGQWTHAGKGASMGLGRYRISDSASLPGRTTAAD